MIIVSHIVAQRVGRFHEAAWLESIPCGEGYRRACLANQPDRAWSTLDHGDTALRLARYFGTSAAVWLRMQARYDLEVAENKTAKRINREVKVLQTVQPSR